MVYNNNGSYLPSQHIAADYVHLLFACINVSQKQFSYPQFWLMLSSFNWIYKLFPNTTGLFSVVCSILILLPWPLQVASVWQYFNKCQGGHPPKMPFC